MSTSRASAYHYAITSGRCADGNSYPKRPVDLQIATRIKNGQNVEAVQIGKSAWILREVSKMLVKDGGIYGDVAYDLEWPGHA